MSKNHSFLLFLLLAAHMPSHAAVLYSNFGLPPSFDTSNGWAIDGGVVAGQMLAVQFIPDISDTLWEVELAVGIAFSDLAESPIVVSLATDSGGVPGTDLADLTLADTVGAFPPGGEVSYFCRSCPVLSAGTPYWVVASIPNLDNDHFNSQAEWSWNTTLDYSSGSNFAFNDTQFGSGWQYGDTSELRPAFEVDSVPEPGSMMLAAFGLAAAFWRRKALTTITTS